MLTINPEIAKVAFEVVVFGLCRIARIRICF
jgi:hypothetical protein